MRCRAIILASALAAATPALAQQSAAAPRAEVLILGSFHMANPAHDIANIQADDILAPRRQQEIAEVLAVLKKFRPTKIAIESDVYSKTRVTQYGDYLAGKRVLTANEIEQLGFRLAKELGHTTIYPVDADGDFPYQRLANYAKASAHGAEFAAIEAELAAGAKADGAFLAAHTILEMLLRVNSDSHVAGDMAWYSRQAHFGEPGDWPGADLFADWTRRNMRIFTNITRIIDSTGDRILVVYGFGHLGWLRQAVANDPALRLRTLAELVP